MSDDGFGERGGGELPIDPKCDPRFRTRNEKFGECARHVVHVMPLTSHRPRASPGSQSTGSATNWPKIGLKMPYYPMYPGATTFGTETLPHCSGTAWPDMCHLSDYDSHPLFRGR